MLPLFFSTELVLVSTFFLKNVSLCKLLERARIVQLESLYFLHYFSIIFLIARRQSFITC